MKKTILLLAALFVLAGCSTTVKTSQPMSASVQSGMTVAETTAVFATGATGPAEVVPMLEAAVMKAVAARNSSGTKVRLKMTITRYTLVNAGARALIGAMAGSNYLNVDVAVESVESGEVVGRYSVERESNPGGYGIFYSQANGLINEAAKGVAQGLSGS